MLAQVQALRVILRIGPLGTDKAITQQAFLT